MAQTNDLDLAAYNIAKDWLDDYVVSTAAVQCSSAVFPPMMQYETIIWERFENQKGLILHHIFHVDEQTAARVHGYIVNNLRDRWRSMAIKHLTAVERAMRKKIRALIRESREFAIRPLLCAPEDVARLLDDLADIAEKYLEEVKCPQK